MSNKELLMNFILLSTNFLDLHLFLLSEMEYAGWVSKSLQEVLSARALQEISLDSIVNEE